MMVGVELADYEDSNFLIIDLFIVQMMFEWENKRQLQAYQHLT